MKTTPTATPSTQDDEESTRVELLATIDRLLTVIAIAEEHHQQEQQQAHGYIGDINNHGHHQH